MRTETNKAPFQDAAIEKGTEFLLDEERDAVIPFLLACEKCLDLLADDEIE